MLDVRCSTFIILFSIILAAVQARGAIFRSDGALVIPGLTRNPDISIVLRFWMPDQVRHDMRNKHLFGNTKQLQKQET